MLYGGSGLTAIEVTSSATVRPADLRGLRAFRADYPESTAVLLHRGSAPLLVGGIRCLPVAQFLRGVKPDEALPLE